MTNDQPTDIGGYAAALDELQEILAALESDTTDVDQLAVRVERADALIRHCRSRLDDARFQIDQVVGSLDDV
ncbi:MAG: exodeoxyribonuclease VII small subunit [Acidimicrobiaceae bacterium]|nr:exodeoxyribonuclease VII small subunit [Acidimicrobiaceae bacterium]